MLADDRLADGAHILPHMLGAVLLHLGADGRADDIAGLQFIRKAVSVFVQQQRALAAHRLRDEEPAAPFAAEQRCGVDLDIVKMAAGHAMAQRHGNGIAGDVGVVGRVFVQPADAAAGQHDRPCADGPHCAVRAHCNNAAAGCGIGKKVEHHGILAQLDVLAPQDLRKEGLGDLTPGDVLMKEDPCAGVRTLAGKAQRAVFVPGKPHAAAHQIADDRVGGPDHQVHRGGIVLIVAGPHRILKKGAVVRLAVLHTDAALRQKGIALVRLLLGQQQHFITLWKIQRTV